ncbi:GNAT family N-acetyltransferase [Pseudogracilibacillus auburnensis]|uniref:RimJ/RimL family protein N-acetyltransferase n=1 Tax=Pseudogracilibacillus auburnensis TaxID=1494959 RepID=A0A2V3W4H9_9BACI|nr:GNAT family N-acetyltransferase [Pseudogracilibacillus auburnensis]PXW87988.1 RimJ/RimL family protein N-acetyltransferase [Pseudogracilibacillus auburnensis]
MVQIFLVQHHVKYAKRMLNLSSAPQVKDALGLNAEQTSYEGTVHFIEFIREQEKFKKQYSRVILNEEKKLIGVITLKDIDLTNKTSHIGTWIGFPYWGKGYNQLAKKDILYDAFTKLDLEFVFAGAKKSNMRSQRAQAKLPYVKANVEKEFPTEYQKLSSRLNEQCILNVIEKKTFLHWYSQ